MKSLFIGVWSFIDPVYYCCTRLTDLNTLDFGGRNIFRVRLTRYKGREVILSDGTTIRKNDILVKIHLHNVRILKEISPVVNDVRRGRIIYQYVKNSFPDLIAYIQNQKDCENIKGIVGITSLNKAVKRLGFEIIPISNPIYRSIKWLTSLPIFLLSVSNKSMLSNIRKRHAPTYLFMSKQTLFNLYRIKV